MKKLLASILGGMPVSWLRQLNGQALLLPYQHTISNEYLPHIAEIYPYKSLAQFEEDVKYLRRYGNAVPLRTILDCVIHKKPVPAGSFILSFDDGFREIYEHVAPILKHYQVEAIFFINPAFINNERLFYRNQISLALAVLRQQPALQPAAAALLKCPVSMEDIRLSLLRIHDADNPLLQDILSLAQTDVKAYLQRQRPYLTLGQLQSLANDGFLIGAHSYTHPYYHLLSLTQQIKETVDSMDWVVKNLSPTHRVFSFPHSDNKVSKAFFNSMPRDKVQLYFGTQNMKQELQYPVLHRYNAERPTTTLHQQTALVTTYCAAARAFGKSIVRRPAN